MDPRFNVFYSYSQGNLDTDVNEEKVLENNLTRALIITLRSSLVLSQYFFHELLHIEIDENLAYDMQARFDNQLVAKFRRFVLGIAPSKSKPRRNEQLDFLAKKTAGIPETAKKNLQNLLNHISKQLKTTQDVDEGKIIQLAQILGVKRVELNQHLNEDDILFLYEISRGSVPDATITDSKNKIAILVENKISGRIVDTQIRRHISNNFGHDLLPRYYLFGEDSPARENDTIPVCLCSWQKDIYPIFKRFYDKPECSKDLKVRFLVGQFLDYVEVLGMGSIEFKREDFLNWEKSVDNEYGHRLFSRLKSLGEEFLKRLKNHDVIDENLSRNYMGINILDKKYTDKERDPYQVPHWSIGLRQHGTEQRSLELYVTCNSKELTNKLLKSKTLQKQLVVALNSNQLRGNPGVILRVMEKSFMIPGGKGERETLYRDYVSFPLELCTEKTDLERIISQAFDAMATLNNHETPILRKKEWGINLSGTQFRSISGVLYLGYCYNWLELENLGDKISENIFQVTDTFKPFYEALISCVPA